MNEELLNKLTARTEHLTPPAGAESEQMISPRHKFTALRSFIKLRLQGKRKISKKWERIRRTFWLLCLLYTWVGLGHREMGDLLSQLANVWLHRDRRTELGFEELLRCYANFIFRAIYIFFGTSHHAQGCLCDSFSFLAILVSLQVSLGTLLWSSWPINFDLAATQVSLLEPSAIHILWDFLESLLINLF